MLRSLVGSEMCIRDSINAEYGGSSVAMTASFPDVRGIAGLEDDVYASLLRCTFDACSGQTVEEELSKSARLAMKAIISALSYSAKCSYSAKQLRDEVSAQGVSAARAEMLAVGYQQNVSRLSNLMMDHTMLANQVVDMEWSFGVTASNSDMAKVAATFIQLKLVLDKGNGDLETVPLELSISQFYHFLQEMEKAKSIIDFLDKQ
eukprot:TRINITY_DN7479_c0_g1_i2.p1 TRINITY_DN7479_c0_g1~~TRINITY_DN7479_c0_g1_i2.p1  ORF type:complete len:205 (-),score=55.95 TRINITY_DN7479_c0_g1_i2:316-930(-)